MSRLCCSDFRQFMDPYLDGEFDVRERAEFDAHLAICGDCRRHYEERAWFQQSLRPVLAEPVPMPPDARVRLRAKLAMATKPSGLKLWIRRLAIPVPLLAAACAVFLVVTPLAGFAPWVTDAVDQHRLTLPVEVPSSMADDVDAWFEGKLPFRVESPRFDENVHLLGGRLSRIGGTAGYRSAAYIIYGVGRHKLSVIAFENRDLDLNGGRSRVIQGKDVEFYERNGYLVALYNRGPVAYAVTSDLPEEEFVSILKSAL